MNKIDKLIANIRKEIEKKSQELEYERKLLIHEASLADGSYCTHFILQRAQKMDSLALYINSLEEQIDMLESVKED